MNQNNDYQQQAEQERVELLKKQLLTTILTKEAYERLARVRSVNPNLAGSAELYLFQGYQAGKIQGTVDDNTLKELLRAISTGMTKDFRITRK